MAGGRKKAKRKASSALRDDIAHRKASIARIDELIAKLTLLHDSSTGTRQGTWKIRIHEARVARRRLTKANRSTGPVSENKAIYHGNGWITTVPGSVTK